MKEEGTQAPELSLGELALEGAVYPMDLMPLSKAVAREGLSWNPKNETEAEIRGRLDVVLELRRARFGELIQVADVLESQLDLDGLASTLGCSPKSLRKEFYRTDDDGKHFRVFRYDSIPAIQQPVSVNAMIKDAGVWASLLLGVPFSHDRRFVVFPPMLLGVRGLELYGNSGVYRMARLGRVEVDGDFVITGRIS